MLQDWRKQNEVSQAELARRCGTTEASISRIENGQQSASLQLAVKLENATGIPARNFLKPCDVPALPKARARSARTSDRKQG